ncbi:MAG: signal peptidase II [Geminicoccaceae bacterium]|nr:signal peptidase II [Geminicoccaceae bacterium]
MIGRTELSVFAAVLGLDQLTKQLVLASFETGEKLAITPFFNLVLVWNPGVSFGLLGELGDHRPALLVALTLFVMILLGVWLWREQRSASRLALVLVLAGAFGNLVDRIRFGAVVDFLDFHWAGYHWPAFNLADSAIVAGAGLLLLDGLWSARGSVSEAEGERR